MGFALIGIFIAIVAIGMFIHFYLGGEDLSRWDSPPHEVDFKGPPSEGQKTVLEYLDKNFTQPAKIGGDVATLRAKRARFETFGSERNDPCDHHRVTFDSKGNTVISGEWTTLPNTDSTRRILYLHGGAFAVGSAISHRAITYNLAKRTGCAVFAPDYRLIPENKRLDGVEDAKAAYKFIVANGPSGLETVQKVAVAGDSAGGNLTLMVIRWATSMRGLHARIRPKRQALLYHCKHGKICATSGQYLQICSKRLMTPLTKWRVFCVTTALRWLCKALRPFTGSKTQS